MTGESFHHWLLNHSYAPRTISMYAQYVARADDALRSQGRSLKRVTHDDLYEWWSSLPLTASSRNGARHALIAYQRYRGHPDGGPAHLLPRIPAPEMLPRPVPAEVYSALREAADELGGIHRILGALLADTGCRINEARTARWHQFELRGDDPSWRIEGKGSRRRGPKVRVVPVNAHLRSALAAWRAECPSADWLFPSDRSSTGYVSRTTLARALEEVCEVAACDRVVPHEMRHTVATMALDLTGDLRATQSLLGHASLATTQIYTKVSAARLRLVTDVLVDPPDDPAPLAA